MDVVIAGEETLRGGMHPAFQIEGKRAGSVGEVDTRGNSFRRTGRQFGANSLGEHVVFRPARVLDLKISWRQQDDLAIVAVNLLLEKEVRSQPLRLRRVDSPRLVADRQASGRGFAVEVSDSELCGDCFANVKEHRHLTAEANVLRAGFESGKVTNPE